jgi:hypothetical protein
LFRGTSMAADILEIEKMLTLCNLFDCHNTVKMTREYFWNHVNPNPGAVGSPRDHNRTSMPFSEHESVFMSRLVTPEMSDVRSDLNETIDNQRIDDDECSHISNDESIFSESSRRVAGVEAEDEGVGVRVGPIDGSDELRGVLRRLHIKNQKALNSLLLRMHLNMVLDY